jgi:diguanylate cyclase (GGDEF)-like protein
MNYRQSEKFRKMAKPLRVLIVEDSENDALLLLRGLSRGGFEPQFERVDTPDAMASALASQVWDIVISDYSMPHFSGLEALGVLKQSGLDLPFILVSGAIGEGLAVGAMKAGAHDYVMKGNLQRLTTAIERELREVEVRRERKQAEEWLKYLAQYDPLTDLPNRNLFYERLEQALISHRHESKSLALMLMDLDHFKEINDTMGHQTGDHLLQEVGRRLQSTLSKNDTVARLGGDEFGVLFPGMTEESVSLAAGKLLKALEPPFVIGELTMDVRASIGVAFFPKHGDDKHALLRRADVAMYLAKRSANSYAIYSPERDSYSPERLALMAELHRAIDNNQLFLTYQPKVDLRTARVIGLEALARWQHPEVGLIPPDQFIAMAERTGFIKSLTIWGLKTALSQASAWREQGFEIPVSVNLSARTLHDMNLPDHIADILKDHGIDAGQLELEITESVIMEDPAHALAILTRISHMGVALSIDDFGTGYSSLGYLKKLPVQTVKIDKSFVINMPMDENDALIVRSTIDLAHNLRLKVVAEGVENQNVWDRLVYFGCDAAQGYYMSRPLPVKEMTKWLLDSPWGLKGSNSGLGQTLVSSRPSRVKTTLTVDDDRSL